MASGTEFIAFVPATPVASAEVTVQQGACSDVTLRYQSSKQPAIAQGIVGTVRTVDSLWEWPQRYASVKIVQIDVPEGNTPFTWSGQADSLGRFSVATPPGKFTVYASAGFVKGQASTLSWGPPNAPGTVTVAPSSVAPVNLVTSRSIILQGL
jgi:hypothetical protein